MYQFLKHFIIQLTLEFLIVISLINLAVGVHAAYGAFKKTRLLSFSHAHYRNY